MLTIVIITIVLALLYDFLNGMNDAANSVATVVSTRVLSPRLAVLWAAAFNFLAYFFFGISIADTIGKGIVNPEVINEYLILSALLGAGLWVYLCTHYGLPISVSHALIGGLIGPGLVAGGPDALMSTGVILIAVFIVLSPLIGIILSYFITILVMHIFKRSSPFKTDRMFRILQLVSSAAFSLGHGSNDAQKTMGIIAVLLYSTGYLGDEFYVPAWVVLSCYLALALGTLIGGWNVIRTLGSKLTALKPVGGFCAESAGAFTLMGTALMGIPVSTTHTITGAIIGVGMTRSVTSVKWSVAYNIVLAWILTIPVSALVAALVYRLILFLV